MPFNAISGLRKPPVVRCLQRPIRVAALCDCIDSLVHPRRKPAKRGTPAGRAAAKRQNTSKRSAARVRLSESKPS
jgi:hypothetical protein